MAHTEISTAFDRQAKYMKRLLSQSAVTESDIRECKLVVETVASDMGVTIGSMWNLFQETVGEPLHA